MPKIEWRVLPSGALACQLPCSKDGREVWLDAMRRVKLCKHGHSMVEIHNWRSNGKRPEWTLCDCQSAKGLWAIGKLELPEPAPLYHEVLWSQEAPTLLEPMMVMGVRALGLSKGCEVYIDNEGRARCRHGFVEAVLRRKEVQRRAEAASKLQAWWRALDSPTRAAVRAAMTGGEPNSALRLAAGAWRRLRQQSIHPSSSRKRTAACCSCSPNGLRRERFGTQQRRQGKRQR